MALINFRLPSWNTDIVSIVDPSTGDQVFKQARPAKAHVVDRSTLMRQPREDGSVQIDHKIDEPIEIQMQLVLGGREMRDVFIDLQTAKDEGTQLTVNLKSGTYDRMFIESINHDELPEMFTSLPIELKLIEALLFDAGNPSLSVEAVANPDDSSLLEKGIQGAITIFGALAELGDAAMGGYMKAAEFTE